MNYKMTKKGNDDMPYIIITEINEEPNYKYWSYPLEEIPYIMEQIKDGDRENGYRFLLYNGRLYETEETETM